MGEIQRTSSFLNFNTVILIVIGAAIGLLMGLAFYFDWLFLLTIPIILAVLYIAMYHIDLLFLAIVFFAPLSINIEEHTDQFELFIPTEPLLFGIMILLVFYQFKSRLIKSEFFRHPIILILIGYGVILYSIMKPNKKKSNPE